MAGLKQCAK